MKNKNQLLKENNGGVSQNIRAELGRMIAGSFYDHQEVRITEFNRIRDIIRRKIENIPLVEKVEEKKDKKEKFKEKFVDKKIPEYLKKLIKDEKITEKERDYIEKILEVQKKAEKYEKEYEKLMKEFVESELIYTEFLEKIRGISTILSANLIKEFGYCENATYISSLWKYCGMHVVNGEAPVRKKGEKLEFNAKLRTMVWKISDSFVKQRTPFYRNIYDKEKKKQVKMLDKFLEGLSKEDLKKFDKLKKAESDGTKRKKMRGFVSEVNPKAPVTLLNADLRARRKMVKIFLAHYWQACKELSQKSQETQNMIAKPYVYDKLKHKHISNWKEAIKKQAMVSKKTTHK